MEIVNRLTNSNIASDVEKITAFYTAKKIDRATMLQNVLKIEEVLLRFQSRFGEDAEYSLSVREHIGVHVAKITVKGSRFDHLADESDEDEPDYFKHLMEEAGFAPAYSFRNGYNTVSVRTKKPGISSAAWVVISGVLGVICALLVRNLPNGVASRIASGIVSPLSDIFTDLMSMVVGPAIFLTVLTSVVNMGDMATFKEFGSKVIRMILTAGLSLFLVVALFSASFIDIGGDGIADSPFRIIRDTLLSIVPGNLIQPFADGAVLQIIFMALIFALAILSLGNQAPWLMDGIDALSKVFSRILEKVATLLPVFIFASIFLFLYDDTASFEGTAWYVIFFFMGVGGVRFLLVVVTWLLTGVEPWTVARYSYKIFTKSFLSDSSIFSLNDVMTDLASPEKYNIDEREVRLAAPLSQIFFKPALAMMFFGFMLATYKVSRAPAPVSSLVILGILSLLFAVATPPSAGGSVAIIMLLFSTLHFDAKYLAIVITADTLLDFILAGSIAISNVNCVLLCCKRKNRKKR